MRERHTEREREREIDGRDVTIVALKLAMSFALFLAKFCTSVLAKSFALFLAKICTLDSPLLNGTEFTLYAAKNAALIETVRILRTVKLSDRESKQQSKRSGCTALLLIEKIEKMNQINTKNYWT